MLKRLVKPISLIFVAFALASVAHFLPERLADPIVVISLIIAGTGSWLLFKQCRAFNQEIEALQHLASFSKTDINQAKLSYFAHEVRTPMHGIMGMLDMIENEQSPARIKAHLDTARKASQNLLMVLNNNIDAAKAQQNELTFTPQVGSIADTCEHVVRLHAGNAIYKGLDFNLHLDPRLLDVELEFDRMRVQQILNNLLTNAIKYTQRGGIKLWISLVSQHANHMRLRFAVDDSGIGISQTNIERLMQPFQQVDDAQTGNDANAGLGLYISNEILQKMGSALEIKSVLDKGTTMFFDIDFPLARKLNPRIAPPGEAVTILAQRGSDYELISQYLQYWNYNCHRLVSWDDLLIKRTNHTIIVDESMARDHLSQLKQLLFGEKRHIVIMREHSNTDELLTFDWHDFKTINKPIMPSELTALMLQDNKQEQKADENNDTALLYRQLREFIDANPAIKLLCVDDNQVNQLVIKKQLQHLGFKFVQLADNGQQALHMVRDTHFDGVFMDFNMPILDGVKATAILRQRGYRGGIFGITALDDDESLSGIEAGMDVILRKPVDTDTLVKHLLEHLVKRPPDNDNEQQFSIVDEPAAAKQSFLVYMSRCDASPSVLNDMLQQLGLSAAEAKVLGSDLIRAEDLKGVENVIVDVSHNEYSQMRIARRLRRLGYRKAIMALSPIESDILRNTFKHFGFDKGGTATTLLPFINSSRA